MVRSSQFRPTQFGVPGRGGYNTRFVAMAQPQKKTRREMLEEFAAAHPNDAFARYGLAMECAKTGDLAAAGQHFLGLLAAHPEYVAAYYQYGQLLAQSGRKEEARSTLTAGIGAAQRAGDDHARSEIEAALAGLG